jgi:long-subunit acyl-CoA synthetase (AMP-forming)
LLKLKEDAAAAQATIFVSVPRVFNKIVDNVRVTINQMVTDEAKRPFIEKAVF